MVHLAHLLVAWDLGACALGGALWWDDVVGQSFWYVLVPMGWILNQACRGSSDTMCVIRSSGGSSSDAICAW